MNAVELQEMRNQTAWFVADNPQTITLLRPQKGSDGAGGNDLVYLPILPQVLRLITQSEGNPSSYSIGGTEVNPPYVLLGEYNADILEGDYWFGVNGHKLVVDHVREDRRYEVWATVMDRG